MRIRDDRLDREVDEQIGVTSTFTEANWEIPAEPKSDDDYQLVHDEMRDMLETLEDDPTTRRAVVTLPEMCCIMGVQILLRERIHVITWLRSSDEQRYREDDIDFLFWVGRWFRRRLNEDKQIMVHTFTSSLHRVVE